MHVLQGFLEATEHVSQANVPLAHEVLMIIDDLFDGLEIILKDDKWPLCIRHAASRAITVLNKYYKRTDDSHIGRFALSTCFIFISAHRITDYLSFSAPSFLQASLFQGQEVERQVDFSVCLNSVIVLSTY